MSRSLWPGRKCNVSCLGNVGGTGRASIFSGKVHLVHFSRFALLPSEHLDASLFHRVGSALLFSVLGRSALQEGPWKMEQDA